MYWARLLGTFESTAPATPELVHRPTAGEGRVGVGAGLFFLFPPPLQSCGFHTNGLTRSKRAAVGFALRFLKRVCHAFTLRPGPHTVKRHTAGEARVYRPFRVVYS